MFQMYFDSLDDIKTEPIDDSPLSENILRIKFIEDNPPQPIDELNQVHISTNAQQTQYHDLISKNTTEIQNQVDLPPNASDSKNQEIISTMNRPQNQVVPNIIRSVSIQSNGQPRRLLVIMKKPPTNLVHPSNMPVPVFATAPPPLRRAPFQRAPIVRSSASSFLPIGSQPGSQPAFSFTALNPGSMRITNSSVLSNDRLTKIANQSGICNDQEISQMADSSMDSSAGTNGVIKKKKKKKSRAKPKRVPTEQEVQTLTIFKQLLRGEESVNNSTQILKETTSSTTLPNESLPISSRCEERSALPSFYWNTISASNASAIPQKRTYTGTNMETNKRIYMSSPVSVEEIRDREIRIKEASQKGKPKIKKSDLNCQRLLKDFSDLRRQVEKLKEQLACERRKNEILEEMLRRSQTASLSHGRTSAMFIERCISKE